MVLGRRSWTHGSFQIQQQRQTKARALEQGLAPLRYVDPSRPDAGPTEVYPHNPNGSPEGIAALCSPCGRHLAIMPHPERSWLAWQVGSGCGLGGWGGEEAEMGLTCVYIGI